MMPSTPESTMTVVRPFAVPATYGSRGGNLDSGTQA